MEITLDAAADQQMLKMRGKDENKSGYEYQVLYDMERIADAVKKCCGF
ncbi:MAG TPA: hypothetical protein VI914_02445 [Thermodesulfobacteriota bacterium]|nr:hypothetical protein [Thermodesulfobacteriota bacterium]